MSVKDTPEYKEVAEMLGKYQSAGDAYYYEVARNPDKRRRERYPFHFRYTFAGKTSRTRWTRATIESIKANIEYWLGAGYKAIELETIKKAEAKLARAQARRERAEMRATNARASLAMRAEQRAAFDFMAWMGNNGRNTKEAPKAWGIIGEVLNEAN